MLNYRFSQRGLTAYNKHCHINQDTQWSRLWLLEPKVIFLNHGAFGACPITVLKEQQTLREQMEKRPLCFFNEELEALLNAARRELATFVGANSEDLVFVPNTTTGINSVLRSLKFEAQDELLTTNHEYKSSYDALEYAARRSGAILTVAKIPFPISSEEQVVESVLEKVSPRTRLALLSHVTSSTGLILPIPTLVRKLSELGIETLVDGAQAPGMLPVKLSSIGATYYVGSCHKWLCSPKGAAFLYVKSYKQATIQPLLFGYNPFWTPIDSMNFPAKFGWTGTNDPTPYLCVPEVIRFMNSLLPNGWSALMEHNHKQAVKARQILCDMLSIPLPSPNEMIGSMAGVPLPKNTTSSLQDTLLDCFGIEVPVIPWPTLDQTLIRISAQIYNTQVQYEYLASVLSNLLAKLH